jgi:radical SAM protein with 4Fe4S-binding SPASM domain
MTARELRRDLSYAIGVLRRKPFQCLLQVTNRCNMQCSFCDFWPNGVAPREELSLEDFRHLERELWGLGRFLVSIEGGEPFVRHDLVEIVRTFASRHIALLYTNGWFVEPASARSLFGAGLAQVGVSIDFPDSRHDSNRRLPGALERAWRAVEHFKAAAPHGGRQVHVMTVLMEENLSSLPALLERSAEYGVGHSLTLLSTGGFRRAAGGTLPSAPISGALVDLWRSYPHLRIFRDYLERIDPFLSGAEMPTCRAGAQSFNVDHVGNVSPCVEKIDRPVGNIRDEPLAKIHARLVSLPEVASCQACWTACRGYSQALGNGSTLKNLRDVASRMRSV